MLTTKCCVTKVLTKVLTKNITKCCDASGVETQVVLDIVVLTTGKHKCFTHTKHSTRAHVTVLVMCSVGDVVSVVVV